MEKRIALWDNLKLFLIYLVVVGHMTSIYDERSQFFGILTFVIYSFHMPAFIFISGLFSKRSVNADKPPIKKAFGFMIIYFFLRIATYFSNIVFGREIQFDILTVSDIPWYMMAMAFWYIITWAIRKIEPKYILITSIVIACFAGYMESDTDFLCILRLINFFPFFYCGYILDAEKINEVTSKPVSRIIGTVSLTAFVAVSVLFYNGVCDYYGMFTCRRAYSDLGEMQPWGALFRLGYFIIIALLVFSIIALCPRKKLFVSEYGKRTLQIYFWHRPILYVMENAGLLALIDALGPGWEWLALVLVTALTALLCPKFWGIGLNYLINPREKKSYVSAK